VVDAALIRKLKAPALIVSDNKLTVQLTRTLLFGLGIGNVIVSATPQDALENATSIPLGLIVAEYGPASFDPMPALKAMRTLANPLMAQTPVVLVVGKVDQALVRELRSAGIEFAVTKPICAGVFTDRVRRALGGHRTTSTVAPVTRARKITRLILALTSDRHVIQIAGDVVARAWKLNLGTETSGDLERAKHRIESELPDVIIADAGCPGTNSLEALAWLRTHRDKRLSGIPAIAIAPDDAPDMTVPAYLEIQSLITRASMAAELGGALEKAVEQAENRDDRDVAADEVVEPAQDDASEDTLWVV